MGYVYCRDNLICCLYWGRKKVLTDDFLLTPPAEADICFSSCYWFLIMSGYSEDPLICSIIFGGNF